MDGFRIEPTCIGRYISDVDEEDIKVDQAVQRSFCWSNEMINNLIYSAISHKVYIPNIILAEELKPNLIKVTYVVDGGQRTEALRKFRYGGYKITKTIRNPFVKYKKKKVDEDNNIERDEAGEIVWEEVTYDLRGKTYDDLPEELKKSFFKCPISTTIYQNTNSAETSGLVNLYNNHTSMNISQKALTYLGNYAELVKSIKDSSSFLLNGTMLTEPEKKKGIWERVISECIMAINHFEDWKSNPKKMCDYLNENSSEEEYTKLEEYFERLEPYADQVESKDVAELFVSKDIAVWMKVFDNFTKLNVPDSEFGEFLKAFASGLKENNVDGISWSELDADKHTKDKIVIQRKVEYITYLLMQFLHIEENDDSEYEKTENIKVEENEEKSVNETLQFLKENVSDDLNEEDLQSYEEDLELYSLNVDNRTLLLDKDNRKSLLGIIAYSYENEIPLDDWFVDFFKRNDSYLFDQTENLKMMEKDLQEFEKGRKENHETV